MAEQPFYVRYIGTDDYGVIPGPFRVSVPPQVIVIVTTATGQELVDSGEWEQVECKYKWCRKDKRRQEHHPTWEDLNQLVMSEGPSCPDFNCNHGHCREVREMRRRVDENRTRYC